LIVPAVTDYRDPAHVEQFFFGLRLAVGEQQ
jgi:hypothetical protein